MRKTSIFIVLISFLISIFLITFYGLTVRDEHMKVYVTNAEILTCDNLEQARKEGVEKRKRLSFDEETGSTQIFIDLNIEPSATTESNAFELNFVTNETKQVGKSYINYIYVDGEKQPLAELLNSSLTFYRRGAVKIRLHTTDGSEIQDFCTFVCK